GREPVFDDVDLTRTVGWFTSLFPVRLSLRRTSGPEHTLADVRDVWKRIPNRGIGFGLLRYLHDDPAVRAKLVTGAEISFNYLGQFGRSDGGFARNINEIRGRGPERCPSAQRAYLLDITATVADGVMSIRWDYSANRHRRSTIEGLARAFAN